MDNAYEKIVNNVYNVIRFTDFIPTVTSFNFQWLCSQIPATKHLGKTVYIRMPINHPLTHYIHIHLDIGVKWYTPPRIKPRRQGKKSRIIYYLW